MRRRGMHDNAGIFVKADTYMSSAIWNSAPRAGAKSFAPDLANFASSIIARTRLYLSKVSASAGEVISAAGFKSASAGPFLPRRASAARN
jgi:hypothetical protein